MARVANCIHHIRNSFRKVLSEHKENALHGDMQAPINNRRATVGGCGDGVTSRRGRKNDEGELEDRQNDRERTSAELKQLSSRKF